MWGGDGESAGCVWLRSCGGKGESMGDGGGRGCMKKMLCKGMWWEGIEGSSRVYRGKWVGTREEWGGVCSSQREAEV